MNSASLLVTVDYTRHDLFAFVPKRFMQTMIKPLYPSIPPPVVPLRLVNADKRPLFVGCLTEGCHEQGKQKLLLSYTLASDLGLCENEQVYCIPLLGIPRASSVWVSPLSVDDSEVVEQNSLRIENQLLRSVQVVFPNMIITVTVYTGAHAKVIVQKIEESEGREVSQGCACMFEGTNFIIAVRPRQEPKRTDEIKVQQPHWGFLRSFPIFTNIIPDTSGIRHLNKDNSSPIVMLHPNTAKRFCWDTQNDLKFSALDLQMLCKLDHAKLTPSFLRDEMKSVQVILEKSVPDNEQMAIAYVPFVNQITTMLVVPEIVSTQRPTDTSTASHKDEVTFKENELMELDLSRCPLNNSSITVERLSEVHGKVPLEFLRHLRYSFENPQNKGGNVLFSGSAGSGKTTVISGVLRELRSVHAVVVQCTSNKQLLAKLRAALIECALCAPSVLVLDGLDTIAPEQKEGNMQAMTAATMATLEAIITTNSTLISTAIQKRILIVATCTRFESVNIRLRSAACFDKFITLNALNRSTRAALLKQLFPKVSNNDVSKMAGLMDNYTPFDIIQVAMRMKNKASISDYKQDNEFFVEQVNQAVSTFTPLAHAGIRFLKGQKVSWSSIGGLSEAKKILYDTLVLPIKHPNLFARLPLKMRSGILLYGPSGCGKTFIVQALMNAENINCIVVNGPEVFGKYIGQSEQKVRDVFEQAQAAAPCVIFFDEFDSIAPQRGIDNSGVTDRVVNQLLCYLDGVEGREGVHIVAASSRPDLIDAALLRPGRLDKAVACPIPSYSDRISILRSLFEKMSMSFDNKTLEGFAEKTVNWTPADLAAMVSTANSLVSQRIISTVSSKFSYHPLGNQYEENAYLIANVGRNTSNEKVVDSIRCTIQAQPNARPHVLLKEKLSSKDVLDAIALTRPSLSEKEIVYQKRIDDFFGKNLPISIVKSGTQLTQY